MVYVAVLLVVVVEEAAIAVVGDWALLNPSLDIASLISII